MSEFVLTALRPEREYIVRVAENGFIVTVNQKQYLASNESQVAQIIRDLENKRDL